VFILTTAGARFLWLPNILVERGFPIAKSLNSPVRQLFHDVFAGALRPANPRAE
jgi:hypothetical protein